MTINVMLDSSLSMERIALLGLLKWELDFNLCNVPTLDLFESTLWKKGRDNKQFLKRIFVLSQKDFTLRYFTKEDVSSFQFKSMITLTS